MATNPNSFDSAAYLAANPDVAASSFAADPYSHYIQYGQNEGRQGFFKDFPSNPGAYGQFIAANPGKNENDYRDAANAYFGWALPSKDDWINQQGLQWQADTSNYWQDKAYEDAVAARDAKYQEFVKSTTPQAGVEYTQDQTSQFGNMHNAQNYQGRDAFWYNDPLNFDSGAFNTLVKNPNGTFSVPTDFTWNAPKSGGFDDWITENGWIIPAAMIVGGAGAAYAGAGAAAEGGAGVGAGVGAEGAGDVFAGYSATGSAAGTAGDTALASNVALSSSEAIPFQLSDGTMGSIQNGNILDASGNIVAKGGVDISAADVLKYANQARQGLGVANTLSKLLGGNGNAGGTTSQQQIAQYLKGMSSPVQTNDYFGQIKMNKNPFLFDIPGQTTTSEGMYDVSGTHPMANALRKA